VRLAYLLSRYPAVSQTFVLNEVAELRRRGVEVHTFTIRRAASEEILSPAYARAFDTTYAVLPPRTWHLLRAHARALIRRPTRYLATLLEAIRAGRLDLRAVLWQVFYFAEAMIVWDHCERRGIRHIHVHFPNVASDVAMLATRYGGPNWTFSMTLHGPTELYEISAHRVAAKVRRALFVVCISDYMRSQVMNFVDHAEWPKLHLIHCGIDAREFPGRKDDTAPSGGSSIIAVGQLEARKGHAILVEALSAMARAGGTAQLTIVGEGPERSALARLASELGVADRLNLTGAVRHDEISEYLHDADVFCMPSFAEGIPVALMEAMACGLPVVASRIMGIPELVDDGVSGTLVTPGNVQALAAALQAQLDDRALRARMGAAGREKVLREFALETSGTILVSLFGEYGVDGPG
jgi:colanic acid/amylovoran biosynthesis glycosyltransferase